MPPLVIERSSVPPRGWDDFARARGIFYHASEWVTLLAKCFRFHPTFTVAREGEAIAGILPLLTTRSLLGTRRLVSLPFSYAAGPIARAPEIATALVDDSRALAASLGIRHVEIKQTGERAAPVTGFQRSTHYARYVLDTSGGHDAVWARLHPNHVRRGIKKALKSLSVDRAADADGWHTMAELQQETSRRHGLPAPPDSFFVDGCRRLQELGLASLLVARRTDGRAVGAIVVWRGPREWIYAFGASRPEDWELRPNHLLLWTAIQDAMAAGVAFDFGRAAPEQRGLVDFKMHRGGVAEPLAYDFWPAASGLNTLPRDRGLLAAAAKTWSHLPLAVTRRASLLYRYLA
jgi:hypothetical protein